MLTFVDKIAIAESFSELNRKDISLGRVNFHYDDSLFDKTIVIQHLHPNGNGFVYTGDSTKYNANDKGLVNIRDFTAEDLKEIIQFSINYLSNDVQSSHFQQWTGPDNEILTLVQEDYFWNIYTGEMLEESFETYNEAESYLKEEGFQRQ
ncbi:hypothetical protein [Thalassobacillus pellis]|uniref:hypothetical protein n=1 Tax=Thalassobacillus pellis TaxID=748008 RepID=UPI0019613B74|nr:hypothetical protein [Thalassobacillus pellis]MBM7551304.1 hypothetical protein [Thalassobacillus pellis]